LDVDSLNLPEKIETSRLLLRRLRYEDAEEIFYTYASKPEATKYMAWPTHRSVEDTRAFLLYAIDGWNKGIDYTYAIRLKETNRFSGSFGLLHEFGKIQFGYILTPSSWGNGYATEVCSRMMSLLKLLPGIYRVSTFVDSDNISSIKVLAKSGLKEEARLKQWFRFVNQGNQPKDCVLMYLPLSQIDSSVTAP
jgi:ribosomal-protein-alanine N-acetyltransferase